MSFCLTALFPGRRLNVVWADRLASLMSSLVFRVRVSWVIFSTDPKKAIFRLGTTRVEDWVAIFLMRSLMLWVKSAFSAWALSVASETARTAWIDRMVRQVMMTRELLIFLIIGIIPLTHFQNRRWSK